MSTKFDPVLLASQAEQLETAMEQIGALAGSYCKLLKSEGFTEEQAFLLTQDWLNIFWNNTFKRRHE